MYKTDRLVHMVTVFIAVALPPQGVADDAAIEAARRRQSAVRTADFQFTRSEQIVRGGISPFPITPDKDMTLESTNRLVVDGDKVRGEDRHPQLNPNSTLRRRTSISLFDGLTSTFFLPEGGTGQGPPIAILDKGAISTFVEADAEPLIYTIRGGHPLLARNWLDALKPTGESLRVAGAAWEEYVVDHGSDKGHYWFDPTQDRVVRRIRLDPRGPVVYAETLDIEYCCHEVAGYLPTKWVRKRFSKDGAILATTTANVVSASINAPVAAEEFDFPFPAGTTVIDNRKQATYRVQPDGRWLPAKIAPAIADASHDDAPALPWYRRGYVSLAAASILTMFVVLALRRRGRIRNKT
jgi:hypothetical protein